MRNTGKSSVTCQSGKEIHVSKSIQLTGSTKIATKEDEALKNEIQEEGMSPLPVIPTKDNRTFSEKHPVIADYMRTGAIKAKESAKSGYRQLVLEPIMMTGLWLLPALLAVAIHFFIGPGANGSLISTAISALNIAALLVGIQITEELKEVKLHSFSIIGVGFWFLSMTLMNGVTLVRSGFDGAMIATGISFVLFTISIGVIMTYLMKDLDE